MSLPSAIDHVLSAARERARFAAARRPKAVQLTPVPRVAPGVMHGGTARAPGSPRAARSISTSSGTGINPWWRYQEQNAPGGGHLMVNMGTGNMLLQEDDMNVPHKGIALAFRRTYNSQSAHDVNGADGGFPGLYGNGWTSTFDAHMTGSLASGTMTVWDIDGARYDYMLAADGVSWIPPPGQHATLVSDGGNNTGNGMLWTKKSGTTYYFYRPDLMTFGAPWASYSGRLYELIGRNRNVVLTFWYAFDGAGSAGGKVTNITVHTESGLNTSLDFADVSGHRLLQQITFPDGATSVAYSYDTLGNLTAVSKPANNAAGTRVVHGFGYGALGAGSVMHYVTSARWTGSDGGYVWFS
jgi:hypothetical protein